MSSTVSQFTHLKPVHHKCAAFDMDDTLIYATSKTYKPYPYAPETIRKLNDEGYNIIIFSNQLKPRQSDKIVQAKVQAVIDLYSSDEFPVPILFLCARADDNYRKPKIGMIDLIPKEYGQIEFFVGDADGSEGSHSDCDKKFAEEAKLSFYTPEEYFNPYPLIPRDSLPESLCNPKTKTVMVLVGYPASGKSTFVKNVLRTNGYDCVSRDELRTMSKCLKQAKQLLEKNTSIVVDNLNASVADREKWIELGQEMKAEIVAVHFRVPMTRALEWNKKREKKIPAVVFYAFRKKFELPTLDEGFDHIYSIVE